MPKKSSTVIVMQKYPPFSTRRWYPLITKAAQRKDRTAVRFELDVLGDPRQAGRTINHDLPAVLTPNSPLSQFLADAFDIHLAEQQPFDLAGLVGRHFQARFDKGFNGCFQAMVAVKPCKVAPAQEEPVNDLPAKQEDTRGLG